MAGAGGGEVEKRVSFLVGVLHHFEGRGDLFRGWGWMKNVVSVSYVYYQSFYRLDLTNDFYFQ